MKIILYQPQIPQNTGNIVRTCAATGTGLILVTPLGFSLASRHLKRAGLDYWEGVSYECIDDLPSFLAKTEAPFFCFSSKATQVYTEAQFSPNALLIFGSETEGLPPSIWEKYPERFYRIPMVESARCLNLSVSVGVALYEALRQQRLKDRKEINATLRRA